MPHAKNYLVPQSYPTGSVSSCVANLEIGDTVGIKGPKGAFTYTPRMVRELGMIAGGTGITPMLQVCRMTPRLPVVEYIVLTIGRSYELS